MSQIELRPSGAPLWGNCPAAANLQKPTDFDTDAQLVGRAAHYAAAALLLSEVEISPGHETPFGYRLTEDDFDAVRGYVEDVQRVAGGDAAVEVTVPVSAVLPGVDDGTADAVFYDDDSGVLYVWDYKHGRDPVDAAGNYQLVCYALGAARWLKAAPVEYRLIIFQPRAFKGPARKEWVVSPSDIEHHERELGRAAAAAKAAGPSMRPGKWCRNCDARWRCSALSGYAVDVIETARRAYDLEGEDGPSLAKRRELFGEAVRIISSALDAIDDELMERISEGDASSGYTIETKPGRLEWAIPPEEVAALGQMFGARLTVEKPVTPTQALKLVKGESAAIFKSALNNVTKRGAGKAVLIPLAESKTARAFTKKGD